VSITFKQFQEIEFSQKGLPLIILKVFSFLTRMSVDEITQKKFEQ